MRNDGFKSEDIGLIINTHSHPDHCQANEVLIEKNQALVALSKEEDEFRNTLSGRLYSMLGIEASRFTPFFYLKEGNLILGASNGVEIQIFLTPGHSPGSICLYWPENKILITGDVIFYSSIGRTDFPGGSYQQIIDSIKTKLLPLPDSTKVYPGHESFSTIGNEKKYNPFLQS